MAYCTSRFQTVRRRSRQVQVGPVAIGGDAPLVVQSMTTTPTQDVKATVQQSIALAEAGCEVVRITAQNVKAAEALAEIRRDFSSAGFSHIPLVADIHFLPKAAMEAVKHVEKVRINPGNYADKKRFAVKEYSDLQYEEELERLHEAFSPIVLRCRELGRAMRIGTNHGSLSDRIMNRYGDSPLGMCESALEFIRIAESHNFHNIILSMKASNPKVMIQAYRLIVEKMSEEDMHYPLHLGVTEAGDGDDARIKSAIGIGSLLADGLGDTIRVSLTEDPVAEIPVARALAGKAMSMWRQAPLRTDPDPVDPFSFTRRSIPESLLGDTVTISPLQPPAVIQSLEGTENLSDLQDSLGEARIEGALLAASKHSSRERLSLRQTLKEHGIFAVWDLTGIPLHQLTPLDDVTHPGDLWLVSSPDPAAWLQLREAAARNQCRLVLATTPGELARMEPAQLGDADVIVTLDPAASLDQVHAIGAYRQLAEVLHHLQVILPIWIRNHPAHLVEPEHSGFGDRLLEASILSGSLLCDGIGDLISIETVTSARQSTTLAYNILQGARARTTKTEYVACPSCGRTLFDLQSTTQRIREATGHLKGVTIAVMGCIVNGPGEMADADFGYVGGSPGKINLYVGKECVKYHIPAEEAVDALIDLIREHGMWTAPA
jgi:(E)-4-hydroxy-3-methylbut-2-enyl-diphosphate synthase